ncbi:MAG TPA: hypothetical protein VK436_04585, partial [Methanocella sp.]|nr:hypothetical protein [Methanocella sp.]
SIHYPFWDMTDAYHNMSVNSSIKNNTSAPVVSHAGPSDSTQTAPPMPNDNSKRWGSNLSTDPRAPKPVNIPTGIIMGLCFACILLAGIVETLIIRRR